MSEKKSTTKSASSANKVDTIYVRVSTTLRDAIERERTRMSKAAGAEVQTSAVIRAVLERALKVSAATGRNT